jgi:hypothetical protein
MVRGRLDGIYLRVVRHIARLNGRLLQERATMERYSRKVSVMVKFGRGILEGRMAKDEE